MRKNNVLVCHKNADEIDEIAYQEDVLVCHGNADQGIWTLFVIRLFFLKSQSLADVISKKYSDRILKNFRKFAR